MSKRILLPGLLGGLTLLIWTFVVNGLLGFNSRVQMKRLDDESVVYEVLKDKVTAPGAYTVNPEMVPETGSPAGQPVFHLRYSGFGHEAAGRMLFVDLAIAFGAAMLAAVLLSMASTQIRSRFLGKVVFIALIGVFAAILGELTKYGIGGYPAGSALLLTANSAIMWMVVGFVMAWSTRGPAPLEKQ